MIRRGFLSATSALLGLLCMTAMAQAQITVCPGGGCDFTSVQAAIDSIAPGGSGATEIHVYAGTYVEGPINFGGIEVDILGVDGAQSTIFTQDGTTRVVRVQSGNIVRLEGISIVGGAPDGGTNQGGGIKVVSGGSLELIDCIVSGNQTTNHGGGVYVADGATARFEGCEFSNNATLEGGEPFHGGGLCIEGIDGNTIDRCFFGVNSATGHGGGLYQGRASQAPEIVTHFPQLRNSIFSGNTAGSFGGGAYVLPALDGCEDATVLGYVTNCTFVENSAYGEGSIYGNEPTSCGGDPDVSTPSIIVANSINWENGPAYSGANPTRWVRCAIDVLSDIDSAVECIDIYPRFISGPFVGLQSRSLFPGSLCIDTGRTNVFGIPIDFGDYDAAGRDRVFDSPLASGGKGDSAIDLGAQEFTLDTLTDLGLSIWTGGSEEALLTDPANWYDDLLPIEPRTWILDSHVNTTLNGDLEFGTIATGSGSLNFHPDSTGVFTLMGEFFLGFFGGQSVEATLADGMELVCTSVSVQRGRLYLEGATVDVTYGVTVSQEPGNSGTAGVRIGTLHGPGTIRGPASPPGEFEPFFQNDGRIRVDGLIEVEGDYYQRSGSLRFEDQAGGGGLGAGQKVEITGQASLGGAVVFEVTGSWDPDIGSSYEILSAEAGFVDGEESFDFAVTQWIGDPRFFVLSTVANANGVGSSVVATVASLEALLAKDESLDSAGVELMDMLLVDVDGDEAKDLVLSVDTGEGSDGQVVILLNLGNDGSWQGFEAFKSVTGITVGKNPRGLDAGYIDVGSKGEGANLDLMVANQGDGTVSVLQNNSVVGNVNFSPLQMLDLTEGGTNNPLPIDVCSLNLDEDEGGYSDVVVACLDASVWTFQNLNGTGSFHGTDPLGNDRKQDRPRAITRFTPGFGGGGGKRDTGPRDTTGSSSNGDAVETGGVSAPFGGSGSGIDLTWVTYWLPASSDPVDLARADLDDDGFDDLVCANENDDSISFMMGTGEGSYAWPVTVPLDTDYTDALSIAAGDVDGDGDLDLVLICSGPEIDPAVGRERVTRIIRNTLAESSFGWVFDGDESLRGQEPYLVRSADIDGDGVDDVIALTESPGGSLAGGDPTYGFATMAIFAINDCPQDLDGNGSVGGADLAVVLGAWGACPGAPCEADFDDNGTVDGADLATLLGAWGSCDAGAQ